MGFEMTVNKSDFSIKKYHDILCAEPPAFLNQYVQLQLLQRLNGVGLLCGTDWTPLYNNSFFYSRLDHSIGTALIVWNFTHDKIQTLSALLHDVSTPAFSHAIDFKYGDTLKQETTELLNQQMIVQDVDLGALLNYDGLYSTDVKNYHKFPVADNDVPGLSADRLEYMYPSGAALDGSWKIEDVERNYKAIRVLKNERRQEELGFISEEEALIYTEKFCQISSILQHNENKLTLNLIADIVSKAIEQNIIEDSDLYRMSEDQLMERFTFAVESDVDEDFSRLFNTFRNMKEIVHSDEPVANAYCISLDVKQRYVNPLVLDEATGKIERISNINKEADECIKRFLAFKDTRYGCALYE